MKKNCKNCIHLEWASGDVGDPEGYICNKVELYNEAERTMLRKMESDKYRERSKKCCKLKIMYYVGYRELFEKPERNGYTTNIKMAGKYTLAQAISMTGRKNDSYIVADAENGYYPRWFIPCSAMDSFNKGNFQPKEMY